MHVTRSVRPSVALATTALLLVAPTGAVQAQSSPYYFGVSQGLTHDSNLYRLSDGAPALPAGRSKSDTVSTTSLLAGIDQPIGRQRLRGDVSLRANRFANNKVLDNEGYGLKLGADLATIERISGSVNLQADRNLARFSNDTLSINNVQRNIASTTLFDSTVRVGLITRWSAEATYAHQRVGYSAAEFEPREYRQNSVSGGVRYTPSGLISFGAALRGTKGRYPRFALLPNGNYVADTYSGRNLDLTTRWVPSGVSEFDVRLSFGNTSYDRDTARDFSGVTGALTWSWRPTGKLRFETRLARDTGQESAAIGFLNPGAAAGIGNTLRYADASRVTTSLGLRAQYEVTGKITLTSAVGIAQRSLTDSRPDAFGNVLTLTGSDRTSTLNFGARWLPTRSITVGCDLGWEQRSTSSVLSTDLSGNTVGCFGQLLLR